MIDMIQTPEAQEVTEEVVSVIMDELINDTVQNLGFKGHLKGGSWLAPFV